MKSFIGKTAFILGLMATTLVARANNLDSILVVPHFSAFPAFILQTDELKQETQVRIWDAKGGLVWSQSVSPNANDKLFNLRHLPEGTYDIEMGTGAEALGAPLVALGYEVKARGLNSGLHAIAVEPGRFFTAANWQDSKVQFRCQASI